MKTLLTIVILLGLTGSVAAQKMDTMFGDFVIGEVTAANEATREITIKYPGKGGPEIFSGFLVEGYKLRLKDGNERELMMNEITPGIRVRAFYKGNKKLYKIVRFEFLGADQWVRLRGQLNVAPATPVALTANDTLPSTAPLKVFVSSAYKGGMIYLARWMDEWNAKHPDSPDKLEVVLDLNQADVMLVIAQGSDTEVVILPMIGYVGDEEVKGQWSQATTYLVLRDGDRLKVLWTGIARVFSTKNGDSIGTSRGSVTSEFEKRLKVRAHPAKK